VAQQWVVSLTSLIFLWFYFPKFPGRKFRFRLIPGMLAFAYPLSGTHLIMLLKGRIFDVFVGWQFGATALGIFSMAQRIVLVLNDLLFSGFLKVAFPLYAKCRGMGIPLVGVHLRLGHAMSYTIAPVLGWSIWIVPMGLPLVLGEQWMLSGVLSRWLLIGLGLQILFGIETAFLKAKGITGAIFKMQMINFPLFLLLLATAKGEPFVYLIAVSMAITLGAFFLRIWYYWRRRFFPLSYHARILGWPVLGATLQAFLSEVIWRGMGEGIAALGVASLAGFVFFGIWVVVHPTGRNVVAELGDILESLRDAVKQ
jgi:O-antigen/teichoic acid export membrane protein